MQAEQTQAQAFEEQARKLVASRQSLVFVETHEEARLQRIVATLAQRAFSKPVPFFTWSATEGLRNGDEVIQGTEDPKTALEQVIAFPKAALYLFCDLHDFYDDPKVVRRLRDVYQACRRKYKTVFLSGAVFKIPVECQKEVAIMDLPLPDVQCFVILTHDSHKK